MRKRRAGLRAPGSGLGAAATPEETHVLGRRCLEVGLSGHRSGGDRGAFFAPLTLGRPAVSRRFDPNLLHLDASTININVRRPRRGAPPPPPREEKGRGIQLKVRVH